MKRILIVVFAILIILICMGMVLKPLDRKLALTVLARATDAHGDSNADSQSVTKSIANRDADTSARTGTGSKPDRNS